MQNNERNGGAVPLVFVEGGPSNIIYPDVPAEGLLCDDEQADLHHHAQGEPHSTAVVLIRGTNEGIERSHVLRVVRYLQQVVCLDHRTVQLKV